MKVLFCLSRNILRLQLPQSRPKTTFSDVVSNIYTFFMFAIMYRSECILTIDFDWFIGENYQLLIFVVKIDSLPLENLPGFPD